MTFCRAAGGAVNANLSVTCLLVAVSSLSSTWVSVSVADILMSLLTVAYLSVSSVLVTSLLVTSLLVACLLSVACLLVACGLILFVCLFF